MKKIKEGYQPKQSLDKSNPPKSESAISSKSYECFNQDNKYCEWKESISLGEMISTDCDGCFLFGTDYEKKLVKSFKFCPHCGRRLKLEKKLKNQYKEINSIINNINNNYEIENKDEVNEFLQNNSSIIFTVDETYFKIFEYLSNVIKVTLEIFTDPEDNNKMLIGRVYFDLSINEALNELNFFDRKWFSLKFINELNLLFNVTLGNKGNDYG